MLFVVFFAGCGSTSRFNVMKVPCSKTHEEVVRAARDFLLSKGFNQRTFLPDSGYYKTAARKVETVSEKMNHAPLWYTVEVQCRQDVVEISGYSLIYGRNSQAREFGASPENESQTEEEGIVPGTRAFTAIIVPIMDYLREFCGGN